MEIKGIAREDLFPRLNINEINFEISDISFVSLGTTVGNLIDLPSFLDSPKMNSVILCRTSSPQIMEYERYINGIICLHEDRSSHLSIISRSKGLPIIVVKHEIFYHLNSLLNDSSKQYEIAIDASNNRIVYGRIKMDESKYMENRKYILSQLNGKLPFTITSNADTPETIATAINSGFNKFWPRSETLLYYNESLLPFQAMILFRTKEYIEKFRMLHTSVIKSMYELASSKQIIFRLLDPPLHEFLPSIDDLIAIERLATHTSKSQQEVINRIKNTQENNPMIGCRGARLLITHEYILEIQILAIYNAWNSLNNKNKSDTIGIFVPFVITANEVKYIKKRILDILLKHNLDSSLLRFGIMIETTSILDYAKDIADVVDFVSFGTNDLTATYYALSRGDCYTQYLNEYINNSLLDEDPFAEMSIPMVEKVHKFIKELRQENSNLAIDICGEQTYGKCFWNNITKFGFDSISIGTENLVQLLDILVDKGYLDENYRSIT